MNVTKTMREMFTSKQIAMQKILPGTAHASWVGKTASEFINAVEYAIEDHGDFANWSKFFGSDCGIYTAAEARKMARIVADTELGQQVNDMLLADEDRRYGTC